MDAYEATRIVFSRIQSLDPKNASKIMGLLLIQDHSEKEMIRLAFGPEVLVHSVVLKAHKELGLVPATPSAAATGGPPSSFLLGRQNSSPRHLGGLAVSSTTSWAPPPVFPSSRDVNNVTPGDDIQGSAELVSPSNPAVASPFYGGGELIEESQLQEQLSFLNDPAASSVQVSATNPALGLQICPKGGDFFYPDDAAECRSPSSGGEGMLLPCSIVGGRGWGKNGGHHRRSFSLADAYLGSDAAGAGFGWRPCLYYAKGYCKNGASCRFLHGVPDDTAVATMAAAGGKMDPVIEQQCQELLLRYKSQSLGGASRLMASAFPYSPTGSVPASPSSSIKCINSLLQQQIESQRVAAAAALMLGGDETQRFTRWSRMERTDLAAMSNRGSRQIYLTFPADSTFREEDVFNYFSIYGPVQDVRIPHQEKRMFGFVTFVYPETVKLILAKGNPHFVCDARVLVKPYKEKGRVPDKYRKQQQAERGDLSGCSTPTSLDSRDPFELSKLGGPRMLYSSSSSSHEAILRRKLEEQQQVAELQQAIELQGRRFMGLQLLDLKTRNQITATATAATTTTISTSAIVTASTDGMIFSNQEEATSQVATGISPGAAAAVAEQQQGNSPHGVARQPALDTNAAADKEESAEEATPNEDGRLQGSSVEHNLPDSPFASPTKASFAGNSFSNSSSAEADLASASPSQNNKNNHLITSAFFPDSSTHDMASFSSCFFQLPRFSSGHGAVRM
ncbi:zinc finger CCCH domain-containing protein 53-like isoform X1 [Phoenix dactylifera]|uniref:Zinc finger CCCH domain-containing protein 53-like isoform X1 n=1 Tax=Phoenix dactylifera TaxID=42345 RepID=A0A8B9APF0_PHODC|nr:zinc finger CCCH domain-containing protein 53-like isoform X1 [Phoenix dactylifera]